MQQVRLHEQENFSSVVLPAATLKQENTVYKCAPNLASSMVEYPLTCHLAKGLCVSLDSDVLLHPQAAHLDIYLAVAVALASYV
eukprot:m.87818 g.87818  ORF g.87818 m.87818 type:complete len:84 (-) comp12841_c0_seq8:986-1237(-)